MKNTFTNSNFTSIQTAKQTMWDFKSLSHGDTCIYEGGECKNVIIQQFKLPHTIF